MTKIEGWTQSYIDRINSALESSIPKDKDILTQAIRYSVLSGGKRLRPLLVYLASELGSAPTKAQDNVGCSVELIHCYSLIHDDLPAMDDDSLRRGKPTCHKKFGDAIAILAGDALQPLAYTLITESNQIEDKTKVKLVSILSKACGWDGMVEGQILDISDHDYFSLEELDSMHMKKTGILIIACLEMGGMISDLPEPEIKLLKQFGKKAGLAFQIRDDVIDLESPPEVSGKAQGSDLIKEKLTYPSLIGIKASKERAIELSEEAKEFAKKLSGDSNKLIKLCDFIVQRDY
ncbi:MAG TPA: polyprenyl synthetase family protein [Gammaproteobacteria bacterium]|nr:polyprenyl synthetase family protein [Gammaproteobacteria bacterium]